MNADQPTYIVKLRPEPNAPDPLKALRWILQTSKQQFGLRCTGIDIQEEERAPAGKKPHLAGEQSRAARAAKVEDKDRLNRRPPGRPTKAKTLDNNSSDVKSFPAGNSAAAAHRRLLKHRPDLHARVSTRQKDALRAGDPDSGPPLPVVAVTRAPCGHCLVVNRCPYCGKRHTHGTGGRTERGIHGHRAPHCAQPRTNNPGYLLVEVSQPVTYVRAVK
jgi:hypothetical protein